MKVLVTGGVRSGKSRHAESLVGTGPVTYVAPGPVPEDDDADWAARVAAHRERRPAAWRTLETHDLAGALVAVEADDSLAPALHGWATQIGGRPFALTASARPLYHLGAATAGNTVLAVLDLAASALAAQTCLLRSSPSRRSTSPWASAAHDRATSRMLKAWPRATACAHR